MTMVKNPREKSHLESKKFVAWLITEMSWKIILIIALCRWESDMKAGAWWLLLAIVVTAGFVEVGFILGQAALDKYVRVAEIAADQVGSKLGAKTTEPEPGSESTDPKVNS